MIARPTPYRFFPSRATCGGNRTGFVLILVLVCLALLAILVLSFLAGSTSEVSASASQLAATQTQNLSSSALNLAMRQVRTGANSDSNDRSWASQPGMIRQFVSGSRESAALYKLYSAETMVVEGGAAAQFLPGSDLDSEWSEKPVLFTDLNEPRHRDGELRFPIVDPRLAPGEVEGFSYSADPGDGSNLSGVNVANDDSARLPMPVRWLYVLQDGSIETGSSSDGQTVSVPGASVNNPIIGRIAFWTDDESCKVNINTASEGVYWDTPMGNLESEAFFDESSPMRGEFQRFPGHPATVSLSAIFPRLKDRPANPALYPTESTAYPVANNAFYRIAPRIQQGGSYEGFLKVATKANFDASLEIRPDADRLYDTVDELIFRRDRGYVEELTGSEIERRRFFLTAHSRASELTLFNTPRISVWPLSPNANEREAIEELIGFSASLPTLSGLKPFYFARSAAMSPTADFLNQRNQELMDYLKWSTSHVAPGFVGTLQGTWGADHNQILTQVFDYIRSGPNLTNRNNPALRAFTLPNSGFNALVVPTHNSADAARGFGRFPTVSEISLLFASAKDDATAFIDDSGAAVTTPVPCSQIWPALILQLFNPMMGFKAADANLQVRVSGLENLTWTYKDQHGVEQTTPMWPAGTVKTFRVLDNINTGGAISRTRPYYGAALLYLDLHMQPPKVAGGNNPAGSSIITSDPGSIRFNGSANSLTIELFTSISAPGAPPSGIPTEGTQTFDISFPPIPVLPRPRVWSAPSWENVPPRTTMASRISGGVSSFIGSGDVIKSLVVRHGDYRMIAGKNLLRGGTDAQNDFVPHQNYFGGTSAVDYFAPAYPRAHTLTGRTFDGPVATRQANDLGRLHPGPYANFHSHPHVPPGYRLSIDDASVAMNPLIVGKGDWDTAFGNEADGAYLNKPDESPDWISFHNDYSVRWRFVWNGQGNTLPQNFSPSRQMASPVMFGSLPTGVKRDQPWQTLLFNPNPAAGPNPSQHPGFGSASIPPDSLLLDLFWLPISEPYAISDRLSTAGKINMNSQIVPFSNIKRQTALHAAMKKIQVTAIPDSLSTTYKNTRVSNEYSESNRIPSAGTMRIPVDTDQTLRQFDARFSNGRIFLSPTEMTSIFLIPRGQNWIASNFNEATLRANAAARWSTRRVTGDNLRERPYNALYPLLTTQSNVYTVHVKAEALRQSPASLATGSFSEDRDPVLGSTQSSFTIERYLNPETLSVTSDTTPLGPDYRLRVINRRDL